MVDSPNLARSLDARNEEDRDGRDFWLWWVAATSVGVVLGVVVSAMIEVAIAESWYRVAMPRSEELLKSILGFGVAVSMFGAFVGTIQWTVLRWRLNRAGWWAPATVAGWSLAGMVGRGLSAAFQDLTSAGGVGSPVDLAVNLIPFILLPGVCQWLVLRRQVNAAGRWLWGSAGALLVAFVAAGTVVEKGLVSAGWLLPEDLSSVKASVFFGLVIGPIYGAITGVVMVRLRQREVAAAAETGVPS